MSIPFMDNVNKLTLDGIDVPERLRQISSPPKKLFTAGAPLEELLALPCVAIVGSRKVSPYGREVPTKLAYDQASRGAVIISSLAPEGKRHSYYSSDWLIVLMTGFLDVHDEHERQYYLRTVEYIQRENIDQPFGVKYQQEDRAFREHFFDRHFVPDYGGIIYNMPDKIPVALDNNHPYVGINVAYEKQLREGNVRYARRFLSAMLTYLYSRKYHKFAKTRVHQNDQHRAVRPYQIIMSDQHIRPTDFHKARQSIQLGYHETLQQMATLFAGPPAVAAEPTKSH